MTNVELRKCCVTLGVKPEVEPRELKRAYRKLAHRYHPDKSNGDANKFAELSAAYNKMKQYISDGRRTLFNPWQELHEQMKKRDEQFRQNDAIARARIQEFLEHTANKMADRANKYGRGTVIGLTFITALSLLAVNWFAFLLGFASYYIYREIPFVHMWIKIFAQLQRNEIRYKVDQIYSNTVYGYKYR